MTIPLSAAPKRSSGGGDGNRSGRAAGNGGVAITREEAMETRPIRLGMVGCGGLTPSGHIPCVAALETDPVVAVCDLREEAARRAAARFPGSRVYTDAARLLEEELDAVFVCAPPAVHEAVTLAALERGRHVFLEKPPSMSAAGARRLVDAAAGKPVKTL